VCLLEAGGPDDSVLIHCPAGLALMTKMRSINWGFETVPQPGLDGRRGYQPRGKVLGGSSSINAMIYIRGQRQDYDAWAAEGNPGWAFDDVLPYFKRAEHNERGADALHGSGGPLNVMDLRDPNPLGRCVHRGRACRPAMRSTPTSTARTQEAIGPYQVTHRNGERCSAAKAYLTPHRWAAPTCGVLTGAHATRILFDGRRAVGVEYRQGGALPPGARARGAAGRRRAAIAAAADAQGIGPGAHLQRHGMAVVHDLPGVGRNLHDHVDVVQVVDAPHLKDLFGLSLSAAWRRSVRPGSGATSAPAC
jgi:choline dehydrogenase-like flavoprotein